MFFFLRFNSIIVRPSIYRKYTFCELAVLILWPHPVATLWTPYRCIFGRILSLSYRRHFRAYSIVIVSYDISYDKTIIIEYRGSPISYRKSLRKSLLNNYRRGLNSGLPRARPVPIRCAKTWIRLWSRKSPPGCTVGWYWLLALISKVYKTIQGLLFIYL